MEPEPQLAQHQHQSEWADTRTDQQNPSLQNATNDDQQQHYPTSALQTAAAAAAAIDYSTVYNNNATATAITEENQRDNLNTVPLTYPPPDPVPAFAANPSPPVVEEQKQPAITIETHHHPLKKRRTCKFPGCTKVVKSQGHCQAHGAKAKRCSVEGCDKQAQTTHEGMCKRHWKLKNFPADHPNEQPSPASGAVQPLKSVYETILPMSIAFRPMAAAKAQEKNVSDQKLIGNNGSKDPLDPPPAPEGAIVMPLVAYLQEGASKPFGWHRNVEREIRGFRPLTNLSAALEPWERQLALVEILLLGGGTPYASFQNLAHGWGRNKGFHTVIVHGVCEQRGDMIRKRKSDMGEADKNKKQKAATTPNADPPGVALQHLAPAPPNQMDPSS